MKKIFKFITFVISVFVGLFTITSCNDKEDKREPLSEEQIIANFDKEVQSITFSKDSINGFINETVAEVLKENVFENIDSLNIPNTKLTVDLNGDTSEGYAWQNGKVVYCYYGEETYKLDLSAAKELVPSSNDSDDKTSTVDYVGLFTSNFLPEGFDIDSYLANIKFTGEEFTYDSTTGYFTLHEDALYSLIAKTFNNPFFTALTIKEYVDKYISSFDLKIGYDGYDFTGYSINVVPNALDYDLTKTYISSSLSLTYDDEDISSGSFKFNVLSTPKEVSDKNEIQDIRVSIDFSENQVSGTISTKIGNVIIGRFEGTTSFEMNSTSITCNLNGIVKVGIQDSSSTNEYEYKYGTPISVSMNGTVSINGVEANVVATSGEYKCTCTLTSTDVTIPALVKATESNAVDIIEKLIH